jgi:mRNA-degrading endonuclease toxin of MazEF toxin-antitoxin module
LKPVERGDVFHVDLNPTEGREQAGARYVVIVSPKAFNVLGTPLVCLITQGGNFARHAGFAVPLSGAGTGTQGVVLCNQPRVLDLQARKARFIETLPDFIMDEILAKLLPLVE